MKQYIDAVNYVLTHGKARGDRTGTGTIDLFGYDMRFNLKEGFPLVTTKNVPIRLIIEELLWFLKGSTNNQELFDKNVHIWDAWALAGEVEQPLDDRYANVHNALTNRRTEKAIYDFLIGGLLPHGFDHEDLDKVVDRFDLKGKVGRMIPEPNAGALGPIYGAQWRSWPGRLMDTNDRSVEMEHIADNGVSPMGYPGYEAGVWQEPIDQIADVIKNLRERPFSRRHVVSAWNPAVLPDESISPQENVRQGRQALASCHCMFQFSVAERDIAEIRAEAGEALWAELGSWQATLVEGKDYKGSRLNIDYSNISMRWLEEHGVRTKELSCKLTQRSADMFLGVPFNIASYALLTMMIAQVVGMTPGDFIWSGGSCHVYSNHLDQVDEQLGRKPFPLPTMHIDPTVKSIDDFTIDSFRLEGYEHHPAIKGKVAV